ncbi:MAG: sensor histidine kinase [Aristaeellaceae bacterium]
MIAAIKQRVARLDPRTHFMSRIWLQMAALIVIVVLALLVLLHLLLRGTFLNRALEEAAVSTSVAATALKDNYDQTMLGFVEICATEDFENLLADIIQADPHDQTQLNISLQSTLHAMVSRNVLADSAMLVNREGLCFQPLSQRVQEPVMPMDLGCPRELIQGVSFLPMMDSPIIGQQMVVPMAFPLTVLPGSTKPMIAPDYDSAQAVLYLYLDVSALRTLLRAYASQGVCGEMYLLSRDGQLLTDDPGIEQADLLAMVGHVNVNRQQQGVITGDGQYLLWQYWPQARIFVVNLVPTSQLLSSLTRMTSMIPIFGLGGIVLLSLLLLPISRNMIRPVRKLHKTVLAIQDGCYDGQEVLHMQDELGQLSHAIAVMYRTMTAQMVALRQEEEARARAEMRAMSEQINPHFLYNTLEAINMEVYAGHPANASGMIQSLGEFLRIGLSFGQDMITVERELEHVRAYVSIMNARFSNRLIFTSTVDEGCLQHPVVKIILQPLVENAIRHGFRMDGSQDMLNDQFIEVNVHAVGEELQLCVVDNGVGIDVAHAREVLHTSPAQQKHVGLNNVYQRLIMRYGEKADITFESIPYYRNTVCIHIPLDPDFAPKS